MSQFSTPPSLPAAPAGTSGDSSVAEPLGLPPLPAETGPVPVTAFKKSQSRAQVIRTALALAITVLAIGALGIILAADHLVHHLVESMTQDSAFMAQVVARELEGEIRRAGAPEDVLAAFQESLVEMTRNNGQFLCLVDRSGQVLCHPDAAGVKAGMTVEGRAAYDMDERPIGSYADIVRRGITGAWLISPTADGAPTELVYTYPVTGTSWTVIVHRQRAEIMRHVRELQRHMVLYLLPFAGVVVIVGTLVVRLLGRQYEREIETMNARLEDTATRRTEDLRDALANLQQAHERLVKGEKMNLLGELMAGIAHEINNPLTSVLVNAELLEDSVGAAEPSASRYLSSIQQSAERCARVVRTLLDFARGEEGERLPVSLTQLVDNVLTLVSAEIRAQGIELQLNLAPELPTVHVNAQQIQQVVMNLVNNAAQALADHPGQKRIEVRTDNLEEFVRIRVSDNGPGVPTDLQDRIFDSFVTMRAGAEGCGLGLSLCKRFIDAHGGTLRLCDSVQGATFEVRLPVAPAAAIAVA